MRLHDLVLNWLSTGTTLPFYTLRMLNGKYDEAQLEEMEYFS
jgi:hypothetical protein